MFDAFGRFANGIISHESSSQGGGGGHNAYYRAPLSEPQQEKKEAELHLAADSLQLSSSKSVRISLFRDKKS